MFLNKISILFTNSSIDWQTQIKTNTKLCSSIGLDLILLRLLRADDGAAWRRVKAPFDGVLDRRRRTPASRSLQQWPSTVAEFEVSFWESGAYHLIRITMSIHQFQAQWIAVGTVAESTKARPPNSSRHRLLGHGVKCRWDCERGTRRTRPPTLSTRPVPTRYQFYVSNLIRTIRHPPLNVCLLCAFFMLMSSPVLSSSLSPIHTYTTSHTYEYIFIRQINTISPWFSVSRITGHLYIIQLVAK